MNYKDSSFKTPGERGELKEVHTRAILKRKRG